MSICYNFFAVVKVSDAEEERFFNELKEFCLVNKYEMGYSISKKIDNVAVYYLQYFYDTEFISKFKKLFYGYISMEAKIRFACVDEDGTPVTPFPFLIYLEYVDGHLYEEHVNTRLSSEFDINYTNKLAIDNIWNYFNVNKRDECDTYDVEYTC